MFAVRFLLLFQERLTTLGQLRLRAENCFIGLTKNRSTVYQRKKFSQRDLFLFDRKILICKKKEETSKNLLQYQLKSTIEVVARKKREEKKIFSFFLVSKIEKIVVCCQRAKTLNQIEILLKDCSFIVQFSGEKDSARIWIETIRILINEKFQEKRNENVFAFSRNDDSVFQKRSKHGARHSINQKRRVAESKSRKKIHKISFRLKKRKSFCFQKS